MSVLTWLYAKNTYYAGTRAGSFVHEFLLVTMRVIFEGEPSLKLAIIVVFSVLHDWFLDLIIGK